MIDANVTARKGESVYVTITLTAEASSRFEQATRGWVQRRLALMVDGMIMTAPIVKSAIGGGHVSITVTPGTPEKELEEAEELARNLRP